MSGYAERRVTVVRPYSYWTVEKFAVWSLKEAGASTNILRAAPSGYERIVASPGSGTAPDFSVERLGGLADHIPNMPSEEQFVLTVDRFYADIFRNGAAPPVPELDEGYAQQLAYGSVPELTVLDDTLVFEGKVILGDNATLQGHTSQGYTSTGQTSQGYTSQEYSSSVSQGKTKGPTGFLPGEGELLTFYSADRKIPVTKPNGTYPVITATVYYTLVPGSVGFNDETKYRSTGAPAPVVVQTPVYVRGSLSMTDPSQGVEVSGQSNVIYVQQKDADTSQIWTVLGEERDYEGYDPAKAFMMIQTMQEKGFVLSEVRQGEITLTAPLDNLKERFLDGNIIHNNNPMFNWYLGNVKLTKRSANGTYLPTKQSTYRKIDGFAAFLDAHTEYLRKHPLHIPEDKKLTTKIKLR